MTSKLRIGLLVLVSFFTIGLLTEAQTQYKPTGFVNDFASSLTAEQKATLELTLRKYEQATTIEVSVVTVPSLEGRDIEGYANALFNRWGVGKADKDNGILFLIAPNDRQVRIEVGYGLEPDLTDVSSGRIINNDIIPHFKAGNLSGGIVAGVTSILAELGQTPFVDRAEERRQKAEAQRKANEIAEKQAGDFLATIGMLAGSVILVWSAVWYIRRRRRLNRLRVQNLLNLNTCEEELGKLELSLPSRLSALEKLKAVSPSSVWQDHANAVNLNVLLSRRAKLVEEAMVATLDNTEEVATKVSSLCYDIEAIAKFLPSIEAKTAEVDESRRVCLAGLKGLPEALAQVEKLVEHEDVTTDTRKFIEEASAGVRKIQNGTSGESALVNWIYYAEVLGTLNAFFERIRSTVATDKSFAVLAREKHASALEVLHREAERAKPEFDHSDVKTSTRERLSGLVQKLVEIPRITDVVVRYKTILQLTEELSALRNQVARDIRSAENEREEARARERRRRAASVSSTSGYSSKSSSSGSSFGGFGGGSSGGGGASGRW